MESIEAKTIDTEEEMFDAGLTVELPSKETIEGGASATSTLNEKLQDLNMLSGQTTPVAHFGRSQFQTSPPPSVSAAIKGAPSTPATAVSEASSQPHGSSPSASQVSVGSIGPTTAASFMSRHYDLTPVTRNACDTYADGTKNTASVTPDECGDILYGEYLTLPSDLSADDLQRPGPPLRPQDRSYSLGRLDRATIHSAFHSANVGGNLSSSAINLPSEEELAGVKDAVDLSRQHYSFISRKQYEENQRKGLALATNTSQLKPYQPSREEDLKNVGTPTIPVEELSRIFIPRRAASEGSTESHEPHILRNPVPMDDRQFSIPSIRLANHLNGSTTSHCTEDEDSILNDDVSLSSRASSLYLPGDASSGEVLEGTSLLHLPRVSVSLGSQDQDMFVQTATRIRDDSDDLQASDDEDELLDDGSTDAAVGCSADLEKKDRVWRKRSRQEQARQWLQSVEADQTLVAEAASSKFLTGTNTFRAIEGSSESRRDEILRQASSPGTFEDSEEDAVAIGPVVSARSIDETASLT